DWLGDPAVRRLTAGERGLWIDMLALMSQALPVGYLCSPTGKPLSFAEIGRVSNLSPKRVRRMSLNLVQKGVASRDDKGVIFCRRIVRENGDKNAKKSASGKLGGAATKLKWKEFSESTHHVSATANLPGQMPQQMPGQTPQQMPQQVCPGPFPSLKIESKPSSFPTAAREDQKQSKPARSLASALPPGALAHSPRTETAKQAPATAPAAATQPPRKQYLGISPDQGMDYRSPPRTKSTNVLQPIPDRPLSSAAPFRKQTAEAANSPAALAFADRLLHWRATIAARSITERWSFFRTAAAELAAFEAQGMPRADIVSALCLLAQGHGWHVSPGQDEVQATIAAALDNGSQVDADPQPADRSQPEYRPAAETDA